MATTDRVLVVDDDAGLIRLLRVLLESEQFMVDTARNGQEALELATANAPDIVLLDLQMPVMDGRAFFKEFRHRGYIAPVVILSAYSAEAGREELGADAALNKPFEPLKVAEVVREMLNASTTTE